MKINSRVLYSVSSILLMFFFSCNKEEIIPSYIHIDKINLTTNSSVEGSNAHKVLDAWIYVDNNLVGAFEMPCTIPVIYSGEHKIKVMPGIKNNGSATERIVYPFYSTYEQTVTLTPTQITTLAPTVTYSSNVHFTWIEDFEGSSPSINDTVNSDTVMKIVSAPEAFEGNSGGVFLTGTKNNYNGVSSNKYILPQGGTPVFLELNFNCNTQFNVGIIGYDANNIISIQQELISLYPTTGWNKVYIELTPVVSGSSSSAKFGIYFSMQKDANQTTSYFYLDNIKIVN